MTTRTKRDRVERSSDLRWVPIAEMSTSGIAQRRFSKRQAESYAADFRLEALGYPVLNRRDGRWFIVDGQHRIAALRQIDFGDLSLECECYEGLTEREEAALFLERNNRKNVTSFESFRVALTAGRETECAVNEVVVAQGMRVARGTTEGNVSATSALVTVYERGGAQTLARALAILRDAYGAHHLALSSNLIRGLGLVCQRYNGDFDDAYAVEKLGRLPLQTLLTQAANIRRQTGREHADCIAAAVIDLMNRGRGGKRLAGWFTA